MKETTLTLAEREKFQFWMRGRLKHGRCFCGARTYNRMILWDPIVECVVYCWKCITPANRPDPRPFPLIKKVTNA